MSKVAYVVLHYQAIDETKACVESIKNFHGNGDTLIVIVDNASPNGTGNVLKDYYSYDNTVFVLLNHNNVGFAKGLNIGIKYIKNNSDAEYIVLLNNDTELINPCWDDIIIEKYKQYRYAALGPDIVSLDGLIHSNPSRIQDTTVSGIQNLLKSKKIEIFLYKTYIRVISIRIRELVKKIIKYKNKNIFIDQDKKGVQLQGSCIILSPKYFEFYESLYSRTFLYFEEAILRYRCEKNNMSCVYTPDLKLLHKGSVSVNSSMKNQRQKQLFYLKHSYDSCKCFLEDIIDGKE